jgi:hypothetical protein
MLANKGSGANHADAGGSPNADLRRAGRWGTGVMDGCYLTTLPRITMPALAGFPTNQGSFWLPCYCVQPPEALLETFFPELDHWLERFQRDEVECDIAGQSFLKLLKGLRVVILQDSILLKAKFTDHFLWRASVFQSNAYQEYERVCA